MTLELKLREQMAILPSFGPIDVKIRWSLRCWHLKTGYGQPSMKAIHPGVLMGNLGSFV